MYHKRAYELVWHTNSKLSKHKRYKIMMKLLDVAERNIARKFCRSILINVNESNSLHKYLEKNDYKRSEVAYTKKIRS